MDFFGQEEPLYGRLTSKLQQELLENFKKSKANGKDDCCHDELSRSLYIILG